MTPKQALDCVEARIPEASLLNVKAERAILRAFIEANTPWLPPQQEGFGPWIEWKPGDLGPRVGDIVCILRRTNRDNRMWDRQTFEGPAKKWSWCGNDIVAYCVKLPEAE